MSTTDAMAKRAHDNAYAEATANLEKQVKRRALIEAQSKEVSRGLLSLLYVLSLQNSMTQHIVKDQQCQLALLHQLSSVSQRRRDLVCRSRQSLRKLRLAIGGSAAQSLGQMGLNRRS
jgi:hypothetical protein